MQLLWMAKQRHRFVARMPSQHGVPSFQAKQHQLQKTLCACVGLDRLGDRLLHVLTVHPARLVKQLLALGVGRGMGVSPIQKWPAISIAHIQPVQHTPCRRLELGQQRKVMHGVKVHLLAMQWLRKQVVTLLCQRAVPLVQGIEQCMRWGVEVFWVHGRIR